MTLGRAPAWDAGPRESGPRESRSADARRGRVTGARARVWLAWASLAACHADPSAEPAPEPTPTVADVAPACAPGPVPAAFAPGVDAELERATTWRAPGDARVLATADELAALRERDRLRPGFARDPWDVGPQSTELLRDATLMLEAWARASPELVPDEPHAIARALERVDAAEAVDHARLVVDETQLYCTPLVGPLLRAPFDPAFDRNLCTTLHPGELLRVLARADAGDWLLVDAGHTVGWVHPQGLGARLAEADRIAWRSGERVYTLRDDVRTKGGMPLRLGVALPLVERRSDGIHVRVPTKTGIADDVIAVDAAVHVGFAELRRDAVLDVLFAQIGAPYGWGGKDGARDCSQLLRDVLVPFGVSLPRHSSLQAQAGTEMIDVAGMSDADKSAAIDRAAARGLVLMFMPGHIMLELGVKDGRHWAISAIAEFLVPCPEGGGDTLHRIDRVAVTDLELGRGSARGAFIERITTLAVIGGAAPGG